MVESAPLGERMGKDCGGWLEKLGALNLTSTWMTLQLTSYIWHRLHKLVWEALRVMKY